MGNLPINYLLQQSDSFAHWQLFMWLFIHGPTDVLYLQSRCETTGSHRKHRQHCIRKKIPKQTNSNQNSLAELQEISLPLTSPVLWDTTLNLRFSRSARGVLGVTREAVQLLALYRETMCISFLATVSWFLMALPFCLLEHTVLLPRCATASVASKPLLGSTIAAFS